MSNNFIPPAAAASLFSPEDGKNPAAVGADPDLDEGETTDSQETVDEDIREADQVNDDLDT